MNEEINDNENEEKMVKLYRFLNRAFWPLYILLTFGLYEISFYSSNPTIQDSNRLAIVFLTAFLFLDGSGYCLREYLRDHGFVLYSMSEKSKDYA